MLATIALTILLLLALLIIRPAYYTSNFASIPSLIQHYKKVNFLRASAFLKCFLEARRKHDVTQDPHRWPVVAIAVRRIGTWDKIWEVLLQARHVYAGEQSISPDEDTIGLNVTDHGGSQQLVFLDISSGRIFWKWPDRPMRKSLGDLIFVKPELAYCEAAGLEQNSQEVVIYQMNPKDRQAEICVRSGDIGLPGERLRALCYSPRTDELIIAVEDGAGVKVYALSCANWRQKRLLIELAKSKRYSDYGIMYSWSISSNGDMLALATDDRISLLFEAPDFNQRRDLNSGPLIAHPACSPDGRYVATSVIRYVGAPLEILIFDRQGKVASFHGREQEGQAVMRWLPDGHHLVANQGGSNAYPSYSIWRIRLAKQ